MIPSLTPKAKHHQLSHRIKGAFLSNLYTLNLPEAHPIDGKSLPNKAIIRLITGD
jgi:hypothetical protein